MRIFCNIIQPILFSDVEKEIENEWERVRVRERVFFRYMNNIFTLELKFFRTYFPNYVVPIPTQYYNFHKTPF